MKNQKGISTRHNPSVRIKNTTAGITLIALVITIIVLLILAGVSISMVIGNNGILNQASTAGVETKKASEQEQIELAFLAAKMEAYSNGGTVDAATIQIQLNNAGVNAEVTTSEDGKITVKFENGNVYTVEDEVVTLDEEASGTTGGGTTLAKVYLDPTEWDYTVDSTTGEATITKYKVSGATTVTIPNYINGDDGDIPVTKITGTSASSIWSDIVDESAYLKEQNTIETLVVSEGIKEIDDSAFKSMIALEHLELPSSLITIESHAFSHCTSLESLTIPNNVTTINSMAFYLCSALTSVTIPKSVTIIEESAFSECTNLITVNYQGREAEWNAINIGANNFGENVTIVWVPSRA